MLRFIVVVLFGLVGCVGNVTTTVGGNGGEGGFCECEPQHTGFFCTYNSDMTPLKGNYRYTAVVPSHLADNSSEAVEALQEAIPDAFDIHCGEETEIPDDVPYDEVHVMRTGKIVLVEG